MKIEITYLDGKKETIGLCNKDFIELINNLRIFNIYKSIDNGYKVYTYCLDDIKEIKQGLNTIYSNV